jgi:hypothetical protein
VLTDSTLARITGRARVEAVEVAHRVSGEIRVIDCDTVVFTGDWIPDHELARSGGLSIDPGTRGPQIDARFRTSAVGVFAAGNVLHGAETAGTAALEGRACAASVVAYLRDHAWWTQPALPVLVAAPLRWIAPNALMPGEASRRDRAFVARTAQFLRDGAIEVRQGDRVVHRSRFRELVPNCSIRVDGGWMRDIAAAAGAVIVSARPRAGNGVAP